MSSTPTHPAAPAGALLRLAHLPDHCAPDCGHGLTQRDVTAALGALARRAAALLDLPPERSTPWADHPVR